MATSLNQKVEQPQLPSEEVLKEWREGHYTDSVTHIAFCLNDILYWEDNRACHAGMRGMYDRHGVHYDAHNSLILNGIQDIECGEDAARWYINWLINDSVFADCHTSKDVDWCLENECVILDPNQPTKLLVNAAFMIRGVSENERDARIMYALHQRGVEPEYAYLMAQFVDTITEGGKVKLVRETPTVYHVAIGVKYFKWENAKAFVDCEPVMPGEMLYSEEDNYSSVHKLFNERYDMWDDNSTFTNHIVEYMKTQAPDLSVNNVKDRKLGPFELSHHKVRPLRPEPYWNFEVTMDWFAGPLLTKMKEGIARA